MKLIKLLPLFLMVCTMSSCTSEYEERLEEARQLKERLSAVEETNFLSPKEELITEIKQLEYEINFLAKVSGNEELFLKEVYRD